MTREPPMPQTAPPAMPETKTLRLLVNGLHSKSGGGITYLRNTLPILARRGDLDLHLCIHADQSDLLPKGIAGVTIHHIDFRPGFWRQILVEQTAVPVLARRIGADVVFSPANYGPILARNAVILLRNAISVAFVERRPSKLAYWVGVYLATCVSLLTCSRAIAVSQYARRSVTAGWLKRFRERTAVVWHGVGADFTPPPEGARRESFILAVSDVYVQKNLRNLLLAIARLRPFHPGIKLKIAGDFIDRSYYQSLCRLLAEKNLHDHVEFLGPVPVDRLVALYQTCAAFVFPSTIETFGNPLVEAMACGAPIASSSTAAMPEILGDAGLFFAPDDVDGIAIAINRFIRHPEIGAEFGRRALERAKRFSWQATVDSTVAVLREAAPAPRDPS